MSLSLISLILLAVYIFCCVAICIRAARGVVKPLDFFIGGRNTQTVIAALSIAIVSLASVGFVEHVALIKRDGIPYASLSLFVIVVPLSGVFLLVRQWIVARRFGYVTPGEMYGGYFLSRTMRTLTVFIALVFAIPFVATQFAIGGAIVRFCFDDAIPLALSTFVFSSIMLAYTVYGGNRAVTAMGSLQCVLFVFGVVLLGWAVVDQLNGLDVLLKRLAQVGNQPDQSIWGRTLTGHNSYLSAPGVVAAPGAHSGTTLTGGPWTSVVVCSYLVSFLGIQVSPAMSMAAYSIRSPAAVALQSMWIMPVLMGILCLFFIAFAAIGSNFLFKGTVPFSLDPRSLNELPAMSGLTPDALATGIREIAELMPRWLVAVVGLCALALLHASCALYVSSASAMVARDVVKAMIAPDLSRSRQIKTARLGAIIITALALILAVFNPSMLPAIGRLAVSFSLQLVPALIGVCWLAWFGGRAVAHGLSAGLVVVFFTDQVGIGLWRALFPFDLPWQHWPLGVHSAVWGLVLNLSLVMCISAVRRSENSSRHRERVHRFLNEYAARPPRRSRLTANAWILIIIWLAFAVGPGAILGNRVFGDPAAGIDGWRLLLPSLWVWQIIWWIGGIAMLWYLGYRMRLTDSPVRNVDPLVDDATDMRTRSGT